jgi:hypothetical protein
MDPEVVIPAVLAIALVYVVAPCAVVAALAARRARTVTCPETAGPALVKLDPKRAVRAVFSNLGPRVVDCARWPERAGCERGCEAGLSTWWTAPVGS